MSTGGATWAAAATLDIGTNTFDISTTVAGTDQPYWAGYWTYTPTGPVTLHLDSEGTEGTGPDTYLSVFTGAEPGTLLTSDDDSGTGFLSSLDVNLDAGQTVHIRLGTYDDTGDTVTILHLNASTTVYVPPRVNDYPINIDYYGPKYPIAWNGDDQHLFESVTNNARHYAIQTVEQREPGYFGGFGYTPTTTSDAPYVFNTGFVFNRLAFLPVYVDAEPTDKYQVSVVEVVGSSIFEHSRIAYPSQAFNDTGFIRAWVVFPDNPTVLCYGNNSSGDVEAWEITVNEDGSIGTWTSLGMVTYPNPGSIPGGGPHYGSDISAPIVFSDRLAVQQNTHMLYDRLNPTVFRDAYTWSPNSGGYQIGDQYFADARVRPGWLGVVERDEFSTAAWVSVGVCSPDASTIGWTTWAAPAGTVACWAGFTRNGAVVAYVQDSTGATRAFYDILGPDFVEFTNPAIAEVAGEWGNVYICPTAPAPGSPAVFSPYDSWLSGSSTTLFSPMVLEMYIQGPPPADPVYPCDQRIVEVLSLTNFLGAPNGQYGDGVIYATEAP